GDKEARQRALSAASMLDAGAVRPMLVSALRDKDLQVATQAATQLGNVGGAEAQNALVDIITQTGAAQELRMAAANALDQMGGAAAVRYRDTIDQIKKAAAAPGGGPTAVIEDLVDTVDKCPDDCGDEDSCGDGCPERD